MNIKKTFLTSLLILTIISFSAICTSCGDNDKGEDKHPTSFTVSFIDGAQRYDLTELYGVTITDAPKLFKHGYNLSWIDLNGELVIPEETAVYSDMILTAQWEPNGMQGSSNNNSSTNPKSDEQQSSSKDTYTVTFNSNGGIPYTTTVEVKKGETVTPPETPVKTAYTFEGWYYDEQLFPFNTAIDSDVTLLAHWIREGSQDQQEQPQEQPEPEKKIVITDENGDEIPSTSSPES